MSRQQEFQGPVAATSVAALEPNTISRPFHNWLTTVGVKDVPRHKCRKQMQDEIWTNSEYLYDHSSCNNTRQVFKGMLAGEQQV